LAGNAVFTDCLGYAQNDLVGAVVLNNLVLKQMLCGTNKEHTPRSGFTTLSAASRRVQPLEPGVHRAANIQAENLL
jgi:hypothetical protein